MIRDEKNSKRFKREEQKSGSKKIPVIDVNNFLKMSLFNIKFHLRNVTFIKGQMPFYEMDCCFSKNSSYKNLRDKL